MEFDERLRQKLTEYGILKGVHVVSMERDGYADIYLDGAYFGSYQPDKDEFCYQKPENNEPYLTTDVKVSYGPVCDLFPAIALPTTEGELQEAADRARVKNIANEPVHEFRFNDHKFVVDELNNSTIRECNILANRLNEVSKEDYDKLEAGLHILYNYPTDLVESMINLLFELDNIMTLNVTNDAELGKACVEYGFFDLKDVSEKYIPYLNYELIGREQREKENGIFYDGRYYEYSLHTDKFNNEQYEAAERTEYEFKLYLLNEPPEKRLLHEKYGICSSIALPYNKTQYNAALASLGIESIADCPYCVLKSGFKFLDKQVTRIESLNELSKLDALANAISKLRKQGNLKKYRAILEYKNVTDIAGMQEACNEINQFDFDGLTNYDEAWCSNQLRSRLPQVPENDDIYRFINYDEYAKYLMKKAGIVNTEYGGLTEKKAMEQIIEGG